MTHSRFAKHGRGFTLIELIAVIVVLGVLGGVALPMFFGWGDEARLSAAKKARGDMSTGVSLWHMNELSQNNPIWPANLTDVLQSPEGEEILNPYRDDAQPVYEYAPGATVVTVHPRWKTIEHATAAGWGAIWYNPNNGTVRFRVPDQGGANATVALYNEVNNSSATTLTQTTE